MEESNTNNNMECSSESSTGKRKRDDEENGGSDQFESTSVHPSNSGGDDFGEVDIQKARNAINVQYAKDMGLQGVRPPTINSDEVEGVISPLTGLYIAGREAGLPSDFLDSLVSLSGCDKKKLVGVLQMLVQVKVDNLGQLDKEFVADPTSHGMLLKDIVARVNGVVPSAVLKVDAAHALRYIVRRYTPKISIDIIERDGGVPIGVICVGNYSILQFFDKAFKYVKDAEYDDDEIQCLRELNKKVIDWTTWTDGDCRSLSAGISSAVATSIDVCSVSKEFYRYCVFLLNRVSLTLVNNRIVCESVSTKTSKIKDMLSFDKPLRDRYDIEVCINKVSELLGDGMCKDVQLFNFSPLSYLLTYCACDDVDDGFLDGHKEAYKRYEDNVWPSNMRFLTAGDVASKLAAVNAASNIEAFYGIQAGNRMYRSVVKFTQEYDTTLFVGPFERATRRTLYMNAYYSDYKFIGLGNSSTPRNFKGVDLGNERVFYAIGVADGTGSSVEYEKLIKDVIIPRQTIGLVLYGPIVKANVLDVIARKLWEREFRYIHCGVADQDHSQFFPIAFEKKPEKTATNYMVGFREIPSLNIFYSMLRAIMFDNMRRVWEAERRYMMKVQLGVNNCYSGRFIPVGKIPAELVEANVSSENFEVEDYSVIKSIDYGTDY